MLCPYDNPNTNIMGMISNKRNIPIYFSTPTNKPVETTQMPRPKTTPHPREP